MSFTATASALVTSRETGCLPLARRLWAALTSTRKRGSPARNRPAVMACSLGVAKNDSPSPVGKRSLSSCSTTKSAFSSMPAVRVRGSRPVGRMRLSSSKIGFANTRTLPPPENHFERRDVTFAGTST